MKEQIYNRLQIEREGRRRATAESVHTSAFLIARAEGLTRQHLPCSLMWAPIT